MAPRLLHPCHLLLLISLVGCRATVPVHVWTPSQVAAPLGAKVALAPLAGNPDLARQIEMEMLHQRPIAKADVALFTAEQLAERFPVRLASTAALTSDLTAIKAAQAVGADLLLQGEILSAKLQPAEEQSGETKPVNMNQLFFLRRQAKELKDESLLLSWRILDVDSGRTLGTQVFTLHTRQALKQYPDLAATHENDTDALIAASARETWKSLAPVVSKESVRLSVPWFQPGAWGVRRGVKAAKTGQWQLAEARWQRVANIFPFNASAHHNLAVASAAREDFALAKQQLLKARGVFAWRLPGETLFWLDQNHRNYQLAHGLPKPIEGWSFPEPANAPVLESAPPIDLEDLPWWTAIPFAKPPEWTWQSWLTQPLVFF